MNGPSRKDIRITKNSTVLFISPTIAESPYSARGKATPVEGKPQQDLRYKVAVVTLCLF